MRSRHLVTTILLALCCVAQSASAQTFFTARLTAAQQPSGVTSEATGTAAMMLTDEGLRYIVSVEGLSGDITNAHFHSGPAGVNGGVVKTIAGDFTGGTAVGMWTSTDDEPLTDEMIEALLTGQLYLNVHTAANGGGEIRGQVYPSSGTGLTAVLTSEQQPGDVTSDGAGTAALQVTSAGVIFYLTVEGLSADISNAHFHNAAAGTNGSVVRGILDDFTGNTAFGLWSPNDDQPLTSELMGALLTGQLYLNVHTSTYPGGEIRGQIITTGGTGFSAALDAAQNGVTSDAMGTAFLTLTNAGVAFHITVEGLSSDFTAAHFHNAPAGSNGGVVRTLTEDFTGNTASGLWAWDDAEPLTPQLFLELLAGNIYINVHTPANSGGEIRGQVLPNLGTSLAAQLTPAQQFAERDSEGSGTATMVLTPEGLAFRVTVDGLSSDMTNAHFHNASLGTNGGVVRGIMDDFTGHTASGVWTAGDDQPLTPELIADLLAGNLYINVHTANYGGGEIRGQVYLNGGPGLIANLTNEQQVNDVAQDASGTAVMTLTPHGLQYNVSVEGLSGDISAAHFHGAPTGTNGGVVRGIEFVNGSSSGLWTADDAQPLTDSLRQLLLTGNLYLNVHTSANPGGEIRGQVRLASGAGAAVHLSADQQVNDVDSEAQGTASLSLTDAGLVFDLTAEGLSGDITNAHFHNGPLGENGGVVHGIAGNLNGNTGSGVWGFSGDEPLTPELLGQLLTGNIYINVHTAANGGGEIRGQVHPGSIVVTAIEQTGSETPETFTLSQNYPNPFNPSTTIEFSLSSSVQASLAVYNVLGQKVATLVNETLPAGTFQVSFEARDLASGLYYYRLDAGDVSLSKSMMLLK